MQKCIKKLKVLILFCISVSSNLSYAGRGIEVVHLQLPWKHQFQFAGYYAALEKGYYAKAGLSVVIHEGTPSVVIPSVLKGQAQYGVTHSELLFSRLQGAPVVALAAIFQHSPSVLVTRENLLSPRDLIGQRIMLSSKNNIIENGDIELLEMFANEGVKSNELKIIQSHFDINDLMTGKTDALQVYTTNEIYALKQTNYHFNVISPRSYGADYYSNILFTSEQELDSNVDRADAFRKASLDGWRYALDHPNEIIDLLHKKYHTKKTTAELAFEARAMQDLIAVDTIELGHLNIARWQKMAMASDRLNIVHTTNVFERLQGFNFDSEHFLNKKIENYSLEILWGGFLFFLLTGFLFVLTFNAKRRIIFHQKENIALNGQISHLQRSESISRLTAGISHDFNNILACMIGYNQLNQYACEDCKDEDLKQEMLFNVQQVDIAGQRATDLIKKMMTYSRQNPTKKTIEIKQTHKVIDEVLAMVRPGLTNSVQINTDLDSHVVIHIDATDLHQIITNLLVNSRDAMKERGGIITLRLHKITVHELVCNVCMKSLQGQFIELRVSDNGSGIDENVVKNIFDPFFTTKKVGEGTGLGLSTVGGIVHDVDGHIVVESKTSEPNQGTAFRLLFPLN